MPSLESAPEHWLRNIRLSGFAFAILALIVLSVVVLAPGLRIFVEQQKQIAELRLAVEREKDSVDTIERDLARWDDPAFIESQARDRLNYVYPRDYTYLVIDDGATEKTRDGAPISDTIQETPVNWMHSVMSSFFTAGLTEETADELEKAKQ